MIRGLPKPSLDHQILLECNELIDASSIHGTVVPIPCRLGASSISYGKESLDVNSTSYGVVVRNEHRATP
jgi:hypothetical protein